MNFEQGPILRNDLGPHPVYFCWLADKSCEIVTLSARLAEGMDRKVSSILLAGLSIWIPSKDQ